jgi:hypothetical protein
MPVTGVPPSTIAVIVPPGATVPLAGVTVMVKVSLALRAGVVLEAETVVVVEIKTGPVVAGHAVTRALRLTEPRPVTGS